MTTVQAIPALLAKPLSKIERLRTAFYESAGKDGAGNEPNDFFDRLRKSLQEREKISNELTSEQVAAVQKFALATLKEINRLEQELKDKNFLLSLVRELCHHEGDPDDCIYCNTFLTED